MRTIHSQLLEACTGELLFLGLKPLQIPVKFLDAFKPGELFLFFQIEGIFLLGFRDGKLMFDFFRRFPRYCDRSW